jgi:hypothetical protein
MRERGGGNSNADLAAKLTAERDIVNSFLFENSPGGITSNLTKERALQVARRVLRNCAGSEPPSRQIKALA